MTGTAKRLGLLGCLGVLGVCLLVAGCGTTVPDTSTPDDGGGDDQAEAQSKSVSYTSTGGTAGLSVGSEDGSPATLSSLDPGAFVQSSDEDEEDVDSPAAEQALPPADGGGSAPPPSTDPPPSDGSSTPPPSDGGAVTPPPSDGTPPPDGTIPPEGDGLDSPSGEVPPGEEPVDGTGDCADGNCQPTGDGTVPPEGDYTGDGGGEYPEGTGDGTEGGEFVPMPPPDGFEQLPPLLDYSDEFVEFANEFMQPVLDGEGDEQAGIVDFAEIPFGEYFEEHELTELIPTAPPKFQQFQAFGEFENGEVPPPPEGFPEFPPLPQHMVDGEGMDGQLPNGEVPEGDLPDGEVPDGEGDAPWFEGFVEGADPQELPEGFFDFDNELGELREMVDMMPPPLPELPGETGEEGDGFGGLGFVAYEEVEEYLPEDFLPPDEATEKLNDFGEEHPLIGEDGAVNPELEDEFFEHPPAPPGFEQFDFAGDVEQFDDLFSVYDEEKVGVPQDIQLHGTFEDELADGSTLKGAASSVMESVLTEATPLVEVGEGVYETQWAVKVYENSNFMHAHEDPENPGEGVEGEFGVERVTEILWTVLIEEVDTDGDGVPDQMRLSGTSTQEVLEELYTGLENLPEGATAPPPPIPPLGFEAVMEMNGVGPGDGVDNPDGVDGGEVDTGDTDETDEAV